MSTFHFPTNLPIADTKTAQNVLAQTHSTLLVNMTPNNRVNALIVRASAFGYLSQRDQELECLNKAVNEQQTWKTLTSRAHFYHRQGDYKNELKDRLQVIEFDSSDARAHDKLASVYRHMKQWLKALDEYDTFYRIMVNSGKEGQIYDEIYLNRGICYQGLKQYSKAIKEYDALLQRVKHHRPAQLHKAECLMASQKKEQAIELLKEIQQHAFKQIDAVTRARAILILAHETLDVKAAHALYESAKLAIRNSRLSRTDQDKECKKIDMMMRPKYPYVDPSLATNRLWVFHPPRLVIDTLSDEKKDISFGDMTQTWLPSKLLEDEKEEKMFDHTFAPYLYDITVQRSNVPKIPSIEASRPLLHRGLSRSDIRRWVMNLAPGMDGLATILFNYGYDGLTLYGLSKKDKNEIQTVLSAMGIADKARLHKLMVSIDSAFVEGCC